MDGGAWVNDSSMKNWPYPSFRCECGGTQAFETVDGSIVCYCSRLVTAESFARAVGEDE